MGVLSEAGGIHKKMNIVFLCLQKHEALKKTGTMRHTQTPAFSLYLSIKQQVESIYILTPCKATYSRTYPHLPSDKAGDFTGIISVRAYTFPVHSTV